jgi:hypothetical protein
VVNRLPAPTTIRGQVIRRWPLILAVAVAFALGIGFRHLAGMIDLSQPQVFPVHDVTIRVRTPAEVTATRTELIRYVFGQDTLPTDLPSLGSDGNYTIHMANGFDSHVRVLRPDTPNYRLILYHAGHTAYGDGDKLAVDGFLEHGFTVLLFDMPLIGENAAPVRVQLPDVGSVTVSTHNEMPYLDPITDGSPIRYFVEPVIQMVNEFVDKKITDISMVGLSGGGWTTTLAAALDTRIAQSYPAAGSVPLVIRFAQEDSWGDWEQIEPTLYAVADYPDLYVLGAAGRHQLQVLNQFDPCCFSGDHRSLYEPQVKAALQSSGGGTFDVYLDTANREHSISRAGFDVIVTDIEARGP